MWKRRGVVGSEAVLLVIWEIIKVAGSECDCLDRRFGGFSLKIKLPSNLTQSINGIIRGRGIY